ncbi:hypothetical protein SMS21_070 [Pseudomonas phage vB_PaeM_SMS21]|uniref:Uncharacterized protein n=3 Tax=Pbunavirus PA8P1 TaxID=2601635 RepID=A0A649V450_9CAUD|nr:hypothetical protein SMS12_070 [Pseudomonas phage vB_PaeM_SMS12]QGJ86988.1 hypothetical protein SMS21_070 [Pseudomonas phage vB_PaeM_SMS21]QGJ87136.1 hypothetical protein SMS29_070 [Pseudomonas phage vB_PaeM_SMS29]
MYNKPTLNHHHQTALLYLYNNPDQPAFTGPNNQALNELRQMGYVKAKKFENWAGTGHLRMEWTLTKAGIERVEVGFLGKCAACKGIGQTLLRGKCTVCNGRGQGWISEWSQKPIEDNPQITPKFEKTDANRLADAIEEIGRLEKALAESEKRGSELAASYCDGVVGDEYGHPYCRYKVERDAALAEVERLRESKGDPSGSFDRCMKMMYERDENAKRLDAALARVAELEGKLTDWLHEGFRLNEALAVAKAQPSMPEISGIGRDAEHPRAVVLYLRNEPSDEDMRAIQNFLRAMAASAQHSVPKAWLDVQAERRRQVEAQALRQEVAALRARADVVPEVFGLERYRVEKTGKGFWPYCVRAGDGTRELFVGHLKQCQRVATELATAFEDGKFIAAPGSSAQHSVPEGWKLVPMDPTSQMTYVGQSLRYDAVNSIGEIYRQMLAVAPSPIDPAAHPQPCQQPQAHPARCGCER